MFIQSLHRLFCFPAQMTTLTTQDDNTSAGTLADLAGRVLSRKSRQAIEDALAALKSLISHADKTGEEMPDEEDEDMPMDMADGDVNLKPSGAVVSALRRGLALHEEGKSGDGLKPETVAWARRMVEGESPTPQKVIEAAAWFARHESDKKPGWDKSGEETPGFVAWLLWGDNGNGQGRAWWERKREELERNGELSSGGYVVELGLTQGKPFAGFALGKFVDMHGRAVEFAKDSISEFLSNTIKAIDAAKAKKMPGLPIDAQKHDKGEAAGWIVSAELGEVTDSGGDSIPAIYLVAEWTSLGVRLLSDKILTNFSPTVDLTNKTIRGGSLTNWPASVDAKGVPLFNAVELTQSQPSDSPVMDDESQTVNQNGELIMKLDELTQEQRESLLAEARQAALAEMAKGGSGNGTSVDLSALADVTDLAGARDALLAQYKTAIEAEYARMQQGAAAQLAEMMAQAKRSQHIAEFSQRITGGTEANPYGLPVKADEIETFLSQLNNQQRAMAESILSRTWESGLNSFKELGHGKRPTGSVKDPFVTRLAKQWVSDGNELEQLFAINPELGDMAQYDLSEVN